MKKATKILLAAGTSLVVLGGLLFVGVLSVLGWDFKRLGTVNYITSTFQIREDFRDISLDVKNDGISFLPSEDGECRVVCYEEEKMRHSVSVVDGRLFIDVSDTRPWYEAVSLSFETPKITVYLPEREYGALSIKTSVGDVTVPKNFSFETVRIDGKTCSVSFFSSAAQSLEIRLNTGNIRLEEVCAKEIQLQTTTGKISLLGGETEGEIRAETNTGSITLTDISCGSLFVKSETGALTLRDAISRGSLTATNSTGKISLESCDAAELSLRTSTGNISGTLLSEKLFFAESDTGRVSVPQTASGGRCEARTSTGSINLELVPPRQ